MVREHLHGLMSFGLSYLDNAKPWRYKMERTLIRVLIMAVVLAALTFPVVSRNADRLCG